MKGRLVAAVSALVAVLVTAVAVSDFKSTFLINGAEYSTLSWLAPDTATEKWTLETLNKIVNNGDTHADVMMRSTAKDFGYVNGVDRDYFRSRFSRLLDSGIAPVAWLVSDDSPDVYAKGLQDQIDYNNQVVDAVDDLVSHYVVCLECDEYYSPQAVSVLIQNLRKKGVNKPIGVHLTPHMYKDFNTEDKNRLQQYYKDADIIYLQTGWIDEIGEEKFRERIEYALTFGKPVVVSEYDHDGITETAREAGNIACSYAGVVGTGNGRGNAVCESLVWNTAKKKNEWERISDKIKSNSFEIAMVSLLLIAWQDNFGRPLPFMTKFNWANEHGYEVNFMREVTPNTSVGVTASSNGRVMGYFSTRFNTLRNIFKSNHKPITRENKK